MKKPIIFLCLMATALISCNNRNSGDQKIHISGTFEGGDVAYVSLLTGDSLKMVDTLDIASGTVDHYMNGAEQLNIYIVNFPAGGNLRFAAQGGDALVFDVQSAENPIRYTVTGNEASERLLEQYGIALNSMTILDSLDRVNQLYADSTEIKRNEVRASLTASFQQTLAGHREKLRAMIAADTTALTNIFLFYHTVGRTNVLSPQTDLDLFMAVDNGLQAAHPDHPLSISFNRSMKELRAAMERNRLAEEARSMLTPGSIAPEIALENPMGEVMKLSDLRGKIVLVDFWAAWCRPCRINNPHLVQMYQKYKDRGFEIYSVSLDGLPNQTLPREEWIGAIQSDQLTWANHVSDLRGWGSGVVTDYGIQGIPFTVLLDKTGAVISTDLRGDALEAKIMEVL